MILLNFPESNYRIWKKKIKMKAAKYIIVEMVSLISLIFDTKLMIGHVFWIIVMSTSTDID